MKIEPFIQYCNNLPPEIIWFTLLGFSFAFILVMLRIFGAAGLYVYIAIAIIAGNIQMFKAVKFSIFDTPVALGTILYASAYLCTDILNELYGSKIARKSIYMGFMAMLLLTVFMVLTMAFRPLSPEEAANGIEWAIENHIHITAVFSPTPVLFIASMTAYLCSQLNNVWMYSFLKKLTNERFLWLRNNGAAAISAFIDDVIFSILAWVVLAEEPLEWGVLWGTYILGTYALRLVVTILDTPVIYLAKYCRGGYTHERKPILFKRRLFISFKKMLQSN